jgi:hypothetical protein
MEEIERDISLADHRGPCIATPSDNYRERLDATESVSLCVRMKS